MNLTKALFSDQTVSANNTFTAADVFPTPTPIPGIADHIVISEVQINSGIAGNDFIEIYNPTSSIVNLSNIRLVKRATPATSSANIVVFSSSDNIQPRQYILWATSDNGYNTAIGADYTSGDNISTNDSIALIQGNKDTGTIIDAVAWGTGHSSSLFTENTPIANPANGGSIERKALSTSDSTSMSAGGSDEEKGNGYDTNNNSNDFILRSISQPQNSTSSSESP